MKSGKLIYLVDDDEDDMFLMREALHMVIKNADIVEFNNGYSLLEKLGQKQSQHPALILMDMNMPIINGIEALHLLKSNPETKSIPVVMVSTSASQKYIRLAYKEGVNAFITKPVSIQDYNIIAQTINACYLNDYQSIDESIISNKIKDKSILIIEDSPDQWELMNTIFKIKMPEVKITRMSDRQSALDYLTDQWNSLKPSPQLIILDLYLPTRRDGLNLLDSINYFFIIHRLQPVPVIVFSSSGHQDDIDLSYTHKANAYMIKSLNFNESFSSLKTVCHFWWNTISPPKKEASYEL